MSKSKLVMTPENILAFKEDFLVNINNSLFIQDETRKRRFIVELFDLDNKECDSIGLTIFKETYNKNIVEKYETIIAEEAQKKAILNKIKKNGFNTGKIIVTINGN